jgi:hypothetical protein
VAGWWHTTGIGPVIDVKEDEEVEEVLDRVEDGRRCYDPPPLPPQHQHRCASATFQSRTALPPY